MSKTYVIGISENARNTINKVKSNFNDAITVLFTDIYESNNSKNIDINIRYDYFYNDFKYKSYDKMNEDLLDSIKDEFSELLNKIKREDRVIIFNNQVFTGYLEIFYYICESLGKIVDNCYILMNEGYSFQGKYRKRYSHEIANKIYDLNYKIYELDGDEIAKIRNAKDVTEKIEATYNEFYNYIASIIKGELI